MARSFPFTSLAGLVASQGGNIVLGLLPSSVPTFALIRVVPLVSIGVFLSPTTAHAKVRSVPSVVAVLTTTLATSSKLIIRPVTMAIVNATQTLYFVGDQAQASVVFQSSNQVLVDPTNVSLIVKDPGGVITTYNYPSSAVSKVGVGQYVGIFSLTLAGTYTYRWVGSGSNPSVAESTLLVQTPAF